LYIDRNRLWSGIKLGGEAWNSNGSANNIVRYPVIFGAGGQSLPYADRHPILRTHRPVVGQAN
jgi:hypothetical protein